MVDRHLALHGCKDMRLAWRLSCAVHLVGGGAVGWSAEAPAESSVFAGPLAEYEQIPPIESVNPDHEADGILRWVWIEERNQMSFRGTMLQVLGAGFFGQGRV